MNIVKFIKISFLNLLIVAILGTLMRYKIEFEFPYFDQKNIQHAHSHFAFTGWISHTLYTLIAYYYIGSQYIAKFNKLIIANLICAYGMLISFFIQGYGGISIFVSVCSILVNYYFAYLFFHYQKRMENESPALKWFRAGLVFNILSTFGTFYLGYMMMTKHVVQHFYLASVYFYLHFQYNGWFLMACFGLFVGLMHKYHIIFNDKVPFLLLVGCCIPTYFLSTLWANLPTWVYVLTIIAALLQTFGWVLFVKKIWDIKLRIANKFNRKSIYIFSMAAIAMSIKIILQLGSTLPEVSKLAFGFRPIVIAYLHLVLLGIITIFIIGYLLSSTLVDSSKKVILGMFIFIGGIFLNEFVLMIQGIAAFSYLSIPYLNFLLLIIAIIMFLGIGIIYIAIKNSLKKIEN